MSGDNTYATIQPRNPAHLMTNNDNNAPRLRNSGSVSTIGGNGEIADYATLRNISTAHPPATVISLRYSLPDFATFFFHHIKQFLIAHFADTTVRIYWINISSAHPARRQ